MDNLAIRKAIKQTILANLPDVRVLLFGSRARGEQSNFSDYDLLIITPTTLSSKQRIYWSTLLNKAIIAAVNVPVDLLINSEEEVHQKQQLPGHIIRSAVREGVAL